jgi:hypothetical protein
VTEEQRSRPGWIGGQNMPEILNGGTRQRSPSPNGESPITHFVV